MKIIWRQRCAAWQEQFVLLHSCSNSQGGTAKCASLVDLFFPPQKTRNDKIGLRRVSFLLLELQQGLGHKSYTRRTFIDRSTEYRSIKRNRFTLSVFFFKPVSVCKIYVALLNFVEVILWDTGKRKIWERKWELRWKYDNFKSEESYLYAT
jgi:hypothetical protein